MRESEIVRWIFVRGSCMRRYELKKTVTTESAIKAPFTFCTGKS